MTGYERKDRTPGFSQRFVDGWVSLRDVMADAERRLAAAGVESPRTDAAILVSHVIKVPRTHMLLQDEITSDQRTQFEILLSRRMARVPLQHLLGIASFRHIDVAVACSYPARKLNSWLKPALPPSWSTPSLSD
jgi:hypothetical protein